MKQAFLAMVLGVASGQVLAEAPRPEDFAYGIELTPAAQTPVYRVAVPESVYRAVTRPDLSDLRVFNAAGQVVPHTLRRPAVPAMEEGREEPLSFFPLQEDGRNAATKARAEETWAYLFDLGEPADREQQPSAIELRWRGGVDGVVARVSVDGSADLARWQPLVNSATLARLRYSGQVLEQTRVELPASVPRYLRLSWPEALQGAVLTEALAHYPDRSAPLQRDWVEVAGRVEDGDDSAWIYELPGQMPVDRAGPVLPDGNALVVAGLFSRSDDTEVWRQRYRGAFYRVTAQGARFEQTEAAFDAASDAHWRLVTEGEALWAGMAPKLRLGWRPHDLFFLSSGDPPFMLAFGAADVMTAPTQGVNELLSKLELEDQKDLVAEPALSARRVLGGEARLVPGPQPFPWRKAVLWAVLVFSVLLLSLMAWKLWAQMKRDSGG